MYLIRDWYLKHTRDSFNSIGKRKRLDFKWANEISSHFSTEDTQMADRCVRRCSVSLNIKETHKIMMRYQTCLLGWLLFKKKNNKCNWACREIGILVSCRWECWMVQPLWKTVRRFLKILKAEISHDSAILLLGI